MPYASQQDLIDRFGESAVIVAADRNGDGTLDATAVARALDDATAEIDAALAARYALPLATVPPLLSRLCAEIALYLLSSDAGTGTEERRQRCEDARASLRLLSKGELKLGLPTAQEPISAPQPVVIPGRGDFARFGGW